jgi:hypothetical protein
VHVKPGASHPTELLSQQGTTDDRVAAAAAYPRDESESGPSQLEVLRESLSVLPIVAIEELL